MFMHLISYVAQLVPTCWVLSCCPCFEQCCWGCQCGDGDVGCWSVGLVSPACQVHQHCLGLLLILSQHDSALIVNISPEIFESRLSRALHLLDSLAKTVAACLKLYITGMLQTEGWVLHWMHTLYLLMCMIGCARVQHTVPFCQYNVENMLEWPP
jgi:hypothetical protein